MLCCVNKVVNTISSDLTCSWHCEGPQTLRMIDLSHHLAITSTNELILRIRQKLVLVVCLFLAALRGVHAQRASTHPVF